jgi:hypothetical protein
MAELLKARKGLRKAGDADHDPADIPAPKPASKPADGTDSATDSSTASEKARKQDSQTADQSDSANASAPDSASAGRADSGKAGDARSRVASVIADDKDGDTAIGATIRQVGLKTGGSARHIASETAGKKARRRRGRPPGPARVATTVRILAALDQALTDACDAAGLGPQDIIDVALAEWLIRHDHLAEGDSEDLQDLLRRVRRRVAAVAQ